MYHVVNSEHGEITISMTVSLLKFSKSELRVFQIHPRDNRSSIITGGLGMVQLTRGS